MTSTDSYSGALWEEINDRLKKVQEVLSGFKDMQADIKHLKERSGKMADWSDMAKLVIKDQSATLNNHESRITKLETT